LIFRGDAAEQFFFGRKRCFDGEHRAVAADRQRTTVSGNSVVFCSGKIGISTAAASAALPALDLV
jgi:hypothetical protein